MKIVTNAIEQSKRYNQISHIDSRAIRDADVDVAEICCDLSVACEDNVVNGTIREFWGTDEDGNEWRVHIEVQS